MRQILQTRFFCAVIAFGALSLFAGMFSFCSLGPMEFRYKSWTTWAIEDFVKQPKAPNLVFLGSSLMLVPMDGVDADYMNTKIDGAEHHRSVFFEDAFNKLSGTALKSFNFSLPGEMPSDAFFITKNLLKNEQRPDVIVYGVGPRDFMDNLLPSPASTDPYRFMSKFGSVHAWASLVSPTFFERFNYEIGRLVYLYGNKEDIAHRITKAIGLELDLALPLPQGVVAFADVKRNQMLPGYQPAFSLDRGQAYFRPATKEDLASFTDNIAEYRKRYQRLKWDMFKTQTTFLTEMIRTARERGTKVVLVAMPITDLNRSILSDHAWNTYRDTVKTVASTEGASFIDFSDDNAFNRQDFCDTVHLNSRGGKRFLGKLAGEMSGIPAVVASLKARPRANSLAERRGAL